MMPGLKKVINVLIGLGFLLIVWQLVVASGRFERSLLPSPSDVGWAIVELIETGTLFQHLKVSLARFLVGYLSASILGIALGLLLGRVKWLWNIIDPMAQFIRPVSPIAWSPFIVLWFGIGDAPAIVIIFLAAFFPVLLSTVSGAKKVSPIHLKLAQNLELGRYSMFTKIIFPSAFPTIANGLHIAVGTAWIFLVSGEMVGTQSGLGFLIIDSRNMIRLDLVLAGIVFIGLCGLLLDQCVRLFERKMEKQWGIMPRD